MEVYTPQNLFAGCNCPRVTDIIIIDTGNLAIGTLLGKITATGKYIKCDSAAVDGSAAPLAILGEAADATAADVQAIVYLSGEFDQNQIIFGGADTAATHRVALRDLSIYLKTAVAK